MPSEVLALISTVSFATAFVAAKRGLTDTSLVAAVLITLASAWIVIFATMLIFDPPRGISREGTLIFAVTGVVAPGIGYWAALAGVNTLGPSISVPIQQGGRVIVSMAGAVLLLRESLDFVEAIGIVAILGGAIGVSRRGAPRDGEAKIGQDLRVQTDRRRGLRDGLMFPVIAGLAFAAFDVLVKHGLTMMGNPTFASMIVIGTGFATWLLLVVFAGGLRRSISVGRNVPWIVAGGLVFAIASMSVFHALLSGRLVLVGPILGTQPLIVFLLAKLLLRDSEPVRPLTVLYGVMVVAGTLLLVV